MGYFCLPKTDDILGHLEACRGNTRLFEHEHNNNKTFGSFGYRYLLELALTNLTIALEKFDEECLCESCGVNMADFPSKLCPGCEAYKEHQQ